MQRDMTSGSPGRVIVLFTLPIFIGNVFQQLYNLADTVIVGKFLGENALAAVGSVGTLMFLQFGLVAGMTIGFTVQTAQYFGAGDMNKMRGSVASAAVLSGGITMVLTLLTTLFAKQILIFMKTPAEIFDGAYAYIVVIFGGTVCQVAYNLLASVLRALGNSKAALYFLILSAVLNIALDLLFIVVIPMGTAGAAVATVLSQGVSAAACLVYIRRKVLILHLRRRDFRMDRWMIRAQLRVGCPMALQYSITAIGTTMVQVALNQLGDTIYIAAFTAGCKSENLLTQAYVALGTAMATYTAQNTGARKLSRIRRGFRAGTLMGSAYAVLAGLVMAYFGKYMTYLFINVENPAIVEYVDVYLTCSAAFSLPLMVVNLFRNGIQGMGYGLLPMTAGIAELVGRGVLAFMAERKGSYTMVCLASPMAWVLASALLLFLYFWIMERQKRKWKAQAVA